jgi:hypothetical protein
MEVPSFRSYGDYASENYGVNSLMFTDAQGRDYYYSYKTLVAFRDRHGLIVRENVWGRTTGKHLNWIDGGAKDDRLPASGFARVLTERLADKVAA